MAESTVESFGPRQADLCEQELLDRCAAIANGTAQSRDCSVLAPQGQGMSYACAGEPFLIHIETAETFIIIDVLHSRSDLPTRIARLTML
ncbi:MAG: type II toxin-antitoxin system RelE/ParE family toxin [Rhodobiaceae bacterium]|nr:type II toxin-antitoxin system RelE/ParE family toxin [Rhodobiaceae bacterium]